METKQKRIYEGQDITRIPGIHIERCRVSATARGRELQPPVYYFEDGHRTGTFELHGTTIREVELIEF